MNATPSTSLGTTASSPQAATLHIGGNSATAPQLPLAGVASTTSTTTAPAVQLDAFGKRGGPDVSVKTDGGLMRAHAVFQMDPTTNEMTVSIVDEGGRLIRMIPPDSVARMIAAMAQYRGR